MDGASFYDWYETIKLQFIDLPVLLCKIDWTKAFYLVNNALQTFEIAILNKKHYL